MKREKIKRKKINGKVFFLLMFLPPTFGVLCLLMSFLANLILQQASIDFKNLIVPSWASPWSQCQLCRESGGEQKIHRTLQPFCSSLVGRGTEASPWPLSPSSHKRGSVPSLIYEGGDKHLSQTGL